MVMMLIMMMIMTTTTTSLMMMTAKVTMPITTPQIHTLGVQTKVIVKYGGHLTTTLRAVCRLRGPVASTLVKHCGPLSLTRP